MKTIVKNLNKKKDKGLSMLNDMIMKRKGKSSMLPPTEESSKRNANRKRIAEGNMIEIDKVDVKFVVDSRTNRKRNAFGNMKQETIHAVRNVSLDIARGELVVLMGLSGSGKTSLLRTINGLNKVTSGQLRIHQEKGQNGSGSSTLYINDCSADVLRYFRQHSVAMVFQQYGLLTWRTVADNVAFPLELAGVEEAPRLKKAKQVLELVGLDKWSNAMLSSLSGGMQQRVGLARALATDAPILLMDEPFSALDPIIRYQLQGELLEINKKLKRTIVFVSHDLDEATRIADRIVIMKDGGVVQIGTPRDIMLKPNSAYVKNFVSEVNPMKVLKARDLVGFSASVSGSGGKEVKPETTYQELLTMWQKDKTFFIVKDKTKTYGTISGDDLLHTLTK